ncbi:MAG: hypothetical protein AABZ53_01585 [Planctomycetota bacterium]|mgnify:CR=1 FL=1
MAQQNSFAKAFLPGLVIGLAVGLPVGAYLSGISVPILGGAPKQANGSTSQRPHDEGRITDPALLPAHAGESLLPQKDPINDKPVEPGATPPAPGTDPTKPDATPDATPVVKPAEPAVPPIIDPSKPPSPPIDPATPRKPVDPK